eukprot:CAMPEP_0194304538 /NCGR_PEP_ID=MMETSP0171-20130528/2273_1 /TAXON_ID=218684 /ORGANISM="Corethron pennatum, Strain L29A3" /LENGTH=86 /DNA_ID=CAMNT_0039055857 /DNA_START=309 /DNA_END=567 /DNA_ORIENTATION=+
MGGNDDGSDAWTYAVDDAEAADIAAINSSPFSQSVFPSPLMFSFLSSAASPYSWATSSSRGASASTTSATAAAGTGGARRGAPPSP